MAGELLQSLLENPDGVAFSRRTLFQLAGVAAFAPRDHWLTDPRAMLKVAYPSYSPLSVEIPFKTAPDINCTIATTVGNALKNRPPLSGEQRKAEETTIDEIINGLNIAGGVKKALWERKQFFTPVVVRYTGVNASGNMQKYSEPTSLLVIDNYKVYTAMQVTPVDESIAYTELRDPSKRESRVKYIAAEILEPLIYAQKSSGKPVACEVGAEEFPTPGLWLDMLPMQSMVVGVDYKAATQTIVDQPDEEIIGWISSASKRGVAITAQLSLEEVNFSDYDFQRVIMPQPGNTRLIIDAMVERMSVSNPDAFCLVYFDPYYTDKLINYFSGASEAEIKRYEDSIKGRRSFGLDQTNPFVIQNLVIGEIERGTYKTKEKNLTVRSWMDYIPYGEINKAPDPNKPGDPRRVSKLEMTRYLRTDYTGTPVPVAVLRPKSDARDPDLPDFDKVTTREFVWLFTAAAIAGTAAALGLNGLLGGKGDSGGSAVPA